MEKFIKIHAFVEGIQREYSIQVINPEQIVQIKPYEDYNSIVCTNCYILTDESLDSILFRLNNKHIELLNEYEITWDESFENPSTLTVPIKWFFSPETSSTFMDDIHTSVINLQLRHEIKTCSNHVTIKRVR